MLGAALLNWYPFRDGKRALLLGSHTEALRMLLERHFDTVDLSPAEKIRSDRLSASGEIGYDCIVAAGLLESSDDAPELLHALFAWLAGDGVLLLPFRNRFGLKYLCGGIDEAVKSPFATLQPEEHSPRLYARREMETMLLDAGFAKPRCYFLMPDADFVQAVYTEEYLPDESIRDRVFPFDTHNSPLVAWEGDLYDDMVRERMLPYLANVYLAECRKPDAPVPEKRVIYAALSTDRGKEHGFATVLLSDGTAEKLPLFPEGMQSLARLYDNMNALNERGILTVAHEMTDRGIVMPLVREEGLLHYLRRQLPEHPEAFLAVFEQVYADVLRSSPQAEEPPEHLHEIWGAEPQKLMPVLKTAWIDMIPYNAFWADGRIRYYDQEFSVQDCPAKYVLFRALRYTWLHIPEAEKVLPLESVKERFALAELWDGFQRREDRFVGENRNWEALQKIYQNSQPDRTSIARRRETLDSSAWLRDVHAVQLQLLRELDRVCRANGLRYMAIHGTLLGAVRHHGFIPWDDDVDVAMPREDYDRLLTLGNAAFSAGFFLQTPRNNYGCFYGGYSKLRRDGTEALEPQNKNKDWRDCHQGIWVDILPLDYCPETAEGQKKLQKRLKRLQRIVYAKAYELPQYVPRDVSGSQVSFYYLLSKCVRRRWLLQQIDRICRSRKTSPLCGILACYYHGNHNKNIWPAAAIEKITELPFEDMMIPAPEAWDGILRSRYGDDYMNPPPIWKRYRHNQVVFNTGKTGSDQHGEERSMGQNEIKTCSVGLVMGVFDLFHVGHLRLIKRAKEHCRYLRVGVLSDELVIKFKNKPPVIPLAERMEILEAIRDVDEVVAIEDNPSRLLEWDRRPFDCFFSGDDYSGNPYWEWEREELRKRGSDIVFFPYTKTQSSTKIKEKMER